MASTSALGKEPRIENLLRYLVDNWLRYATLVITAVGIVIAFDLDRAESVATIAAMIAILEFVEPILRTVKETKADLASATSGMVYEQAETLPFLEAAHRIYKKALRSERNHTLRVARLHPYWGSGLTINQEPAVVRAFQQMMGTFRTFPYRGWRVKQLWAVSDSASLPEIRSRVIDRSFEENKLPGPGTLEIKLIIATPGKYSISPFLTDQDVILGLYFGPDQLAHSGIIIENREDVKKIFTRWFEQLWVSESTIWVYDDNVRQRVLSTVAQNEGDLQDCLGKEVDEILRKVGERLAQPLLAPTTNRRRPV